MTDLSILDSIPTFNITFQNESFVLSHLLYFRNITDWGPKRDPLFIVIPFTIIFLVIFVCGLIGNISTCIVIACNRSMHTATNYYLFSLAISDLLLLISGLPQEIYYTWSKYPYIFGEPFCIIQGFAAETSANATVLTITAFTVERYIAICHPFSRHSLSKLHRVVKLVIILWVFAVCLAIPQAMSFGIVYDNALNKLLKNNDHYTCSVKRLVIPHAFLISTLLFFIMPMSLITIFYILIYLQLRQSSVGPIHGGSIKLSELVYKQSCITQCHPKSNQTTILLNEDKDTKLRVFNENIEDGKTSNQHLFTSQHVVKMLGMY